MSWNDQHRRLGVLLFGVVLGCAPDDAPADDEATSTDVDTLDDIDTTSDTAGDGSDEGLPPDLPTDPTSDCDRLDQLLIDLPAEPDPAAHQALIDELVRTVSYGEHGFPIIDIDQSCQPTAAGMLAVVHQSAPGQTISVAGDFNGWNADEHVLAELVPGFYVAQIELPSPPAGLYKLVHDGQFFADPLARRFGWDEFGEYSQIDPLPDRGHHERWLGFDQSVGQLEPRTLTVYLPAGAFDDVELPVLYMHDGQNLFAPDALFGGWQVSETLEQAIAQATLSPVVVVGIDNTAARFDEYTHVPDVIDGMQVGGRADEYADFLVDGIKPFVESRYPVASTPESIGIMGSSLGGLVSLYIGLHHADDFGHVGSMSGTIDWGTFGAANPTILDEYVAAPPLGISIYLDSGGDPGLGCPDDGSDNYCGNVALADALREAGWVDEVDLYYRWDQGAPHNEAAWASRLLPALQDWFPG